MEKKTGLLLSVMLACILLAGCGADDMPRDGQELTQSEQDSQEFIQNEQDGQEPVEILEDVQELSQSSEEGQELARNPEDTQEPAQNPESEQGSAQNPQVQPEEWTDAGDSRYGAFLRNKISVANPYVEGMNLTVMDDKMYESEFENAKKKYAYVDVNGDENPELIFRISSDPSELMYILGICDDELVCFDVFETHTKNISFGVYDYGFVWEVQNDDGFGMTCYTYTADGQPVTARHFTEENEADIAAYEGEEPEWIDW